MNLDDLPPGDTGGLSLTTKSPLSRCKSRTALLKDVPLGARISVAFSGVNAFVPIIVTAGAGGSSPAAATAADEETPSHTASRWGCVGGASASKEPKERQVLFDVTACVEPGAQERGGPTLPPTAPRGE